MPYPNLISGIGWFILGVKVQGFLAPCVPSDRAFSVSMRTSVGCRRCTRAFPTQWMSRAVADSRSLQLSVRETAVDADVGPTKEEGHAVLDALIEQFASPENGNVTATVDEYLDLCDHAFLTHLRSRIASVGSESSTVRKLPNRVHVCPGFTWFKVKRVWELVYWSGPLMKSPHQFHDTYMTSWTTPLLRIYPSYFRFNNQLIDTWYSSP